MTKEKLLELEIYCPSKIDLNIVVYLKLGFKVLLAYYNGLAAMRCDYILLEYDPEFYSTLDFSAFISLRSICNIEYIAEVHYLESYVFINNQYVFTIHVGSNQIEDLKLYLTNYGNKN